MKQNIMIIFSNCIFKIKSEDILIVSFAQCKKMIVLRMPKKFAIFKKILKPGSFGVVFIGGFR